MTTPTSFIHLLRLIKNGDPVDESTINRILRDLFANEEHLLALIDALGASQAIFRRDVTLDPAALVGQPVFYNSTTLRFERGLAQAVVDDGVLQTSKSSQIWGIVSVKHNSTSGDILLQGFSSAVDITNATGASPAAGLYFLSAVDPGKLTLQEPPVSIPVLQYDGDSGVYVRPNFADLYTAHQHYKFSLKCVPSGLPLLSLGHWSITSPDTAIEGWLPADHASFGGNAPDGAAFGYNLAASSFANAWPPLPLAGATAEWVNDMAEVELPLQSEKMVIDQHGIWWMTDCEDHVPWPLNFDATSTTTTLAPNSCPPLEPMSLVLWYTRPKFQTSSNVVNSLTPADNSIITIRCLDGDDENQSTGHLEIDIDLDLLLDSDITTDGFIVLKGLSEDGKLTRGPVVSKIKAGGANVILSSSSGPDVSGYHAGAVTVSVLQSLLGTEIPVEDIRLKKAEESFYKEVIALTFPQGIKSSYRASIYVPNDLGVSAVTLGLRFWLLARAAGVLPSLTLTARVFDKPASIGTLPTTDSAVTLTIPGTTLAVDEYIEVTSANISAAPGSMVQFTLERDDSGGGDGFNGEVHLLRQRGVITGAS